MIVRQEFDLSDEAAQALDKAIQRSANVDWSDVLQAMRGQGWAIWNVGGQCWCFTVVNIEDEIEVWLAGGENIRACLGPWEAAMRAHPAHRGMTMRAEGMGNRRGWQRLLPHWQLDEGGTLTMRIPG